jgi:excisionase family DNA binding protein
MSNQNEQGSEGRSVLIDAAAAVLGVSRRTVYYRIRAGQLQTMRTRNGSQRVLWESIEALRHKPDAAPVPMVPEVEASDDTSLGVGL